MHMEAAASFRIAVRMIRTINRVTSPRPLFYQAFRQEKTDVASNLSWMRLRVLRRDRYRCRGCGEKGDEITLGLQPIHPHPSNADEILTLCARCQDFVKRWNIKGRDRSGFLQQFRRYFHCSMDPQSPAPSNGERAEALEGSS
jgi:hypothetical protein